MIWTGKLIVGGLAYLIFHHPIAVLIGLVIGHQLDKKAAQIRAYNPFRPTPPREREKLNEALMEAVFSILGHLAKADGRVSEREIAQAEALMSRMGLSTEKRRQAIAYFNVGKDANFPLDDAVAKFRHQTRYRKVVVLNFLEMLVSASLADGHLHPAEERILLRVAQGLGIPAAHFQQILSMLMAQAQFSRGGYGGQGDYSRYHQQSQQAGSAYRPGQRLDSAYGVLGLSASASDADVKKAYRKLMSRHHPDKLAAQGLGEEAIRDANEKAAKISQAYEMIKQHRGFK